MKNDSRINVSAWRIGTFVYGSVSLCLSPLLVISQAYADVPTPPPAYHKQIDTSFPSGKALLDQGYNPNTGVLKVEGQKTGKPTVTSNGQTVTGTQNARVVVTDQYGNKGTMTTKITQTANAVVIANVVGNAVGNGVDAYERYISDQIKDGNYSGAAETVFAAFARSLDELSGGNLSRLKRWSGGDGTGLIDQHDARMNDYYGGGNPTTGNPSSPSTGNSSSPSTGTPTSPGNPSNPSVGGGGSSAGLGAAANAAGSAQRTAERNGDVSGAIGNAAFKKAADAAGNAASSASGATTSGAKLADASRNKDGSYSQLFLRRIDLKSGSNINPKPEIQGIAWQIDKYNGVHNWSTLESATWLKVSVMPPSGYTSIYVSGSYFKPITSDKDLADAQKLVAGMSVSEQQQLKQDMTLSADEITDILRRMFASQQTNHQEMMRQLSQISANTAPNTSTSTSTETTPPSTTGSQVIRGGDSVVDQATTSRTVSTAEAISSPFTPANSNVAGRTKFTLNSDGSVTTTFVPDTSLKPHSSQAPTRVSAAPASSQTADATTPNIPGQTTPSPATPDTANPTQTIPNQPGSQQNQEQRDFCQMNPTAAACMELGSGDYEDLDVPESELDLNFEPADIFQTDGVCPEPKTVDLGMFGTVEFSYQMLCDFASKIRPILVAMTVLMCAYFAYESVREL
ncbi:virulence factor TspB C-terminal domain-related protein [Neisseria sp.]|uniref:virulence factor TspB C-terminal domain-related protein n=1 Tax=Neisseria sp. TaxID=192066 RepID=UPI0026DCE400|nr:virulence factor TspB C-terminal domain-related protein [Neisseria sp.]MDO4226830.1 virulence factor TspB C-terminal domain-related protein [Neisseria sp.]